MTVGQACTCRSFVILIPIESGVMPGSAHWSWVPFPMETKMQSRKAGALIHNCKLWSMPRSQTIGTA